MADTNLPSPAAHAPMRPSLGLVAVLALFVLVLAGVGYWLTGSPSLTRPGATAAAAPADAASDASAAAGLQQIEAMVDKLAERLKTTPDDAEGWSMLARSYAVLGRFGEAVPAYAHAAELMPNDARVLSDYAAAIAATQGTVNNPQSAALIERALKADSKQAKALALAGSAAFDRGEYPIAIGYWQKIVDGLPPDSELLPRVQAMIAEARSKVGSGGPASAGPSATAKAETAPAPTAAPPATGTSVSGTVTLDPALAAKVAPTDSVFVFARAASGSRMPLAVKRAQVKDLSLIHI